MEFIRNMQVRFRDALCRLRFEVGQTTAEYALVLLAAAAIAVLLISWARGNNAMTDFFDAVVDKLTGQASSF